MKIIGYIVKTTPTLPCFPYHQFFSLPNMNLFSFKFALGVPRSRYINCLFWLWFLGFGLSSSPILPYFQAKIHILPYL